MMEEKTIGYFCILAIATGIIVGIIFAIPYYHNYGIMSSCETGEILYISKIAPPIKSTVDYYTCKINVTVLYDNNTICSSSSNTLKNGLSINYCQNLRNYKGKILTIKAYFYNLNGEIISSDEKILIVP